MAVITIREATVADAAAVAEAHVRAWQVGYEGIFPTEFLESLNLEERTESWRAIYAGETLVEGVPRPTDYVAEVDGKVVAFADVGAYRASLDPTKGELWAMYVHPDHWGTGVGSALMDACFVELKRLAYEVAYLWVLEDNDRARRFYESHGWIEDTETQASDIGDSKVVERRYRCNV